MCMIIALGVLNKKRVVMKKISMIMVALVLMLSPVVASERVIFDHDRRIEFSALPAEAQAFVKEYFADAKVSFVELDEGLISNEYKVVFENGLKVEFDGSGNWTEVDSHYNAVPNAIVPQQIADYIKSNYSDSKVVEIKRERYEWELKLSNGLELSFDKSFRLTDIDD